MKRLKQLLLSGMVLTIILSLSACGGGGGTSTTSPSFTGPEEVLYSFGSSAQSHDDGAYPYGGHLLLANDGNFYGMTKFGGSAGVGAIVKITPSGQTRVLWSFGGTSDGQYPLGSLIQGSDGNFYGMTAGGGANNSGVV